jgi:protein phosphatase
MANPGKKFTLRSSARTSVGQVRENNEDNVHLWGGVDAVLAVVADGMGGAAAGEEASRLTIEAIDGEMTTTKDAPIQTFDELNEDSIAQKLREIVRLANNDIVRKADQDPELRGMGTTATLAFVRNMHAIVAHVGDSRAYLISPRDDEITQITADHSFVEALVAAGHITPDQAEDHPMRNVLYRALGQTEDVDVDVYHSRMRVGDWLLLCSDGLTRHLKPDDIVEIVLSGDEPDKLTQALIDRANERGGEDNVSVVLIHLEGEPDEADAERTIVLKSDVVKRDEDEDTLILDSANVEKDDDNAGGDDIEVVVDAESVIDTWHGSENEDNPPPAESDDNPIDRAIADRSRIVSEERKKDDDSPPPE